MIDDAAADALAAVAAAAAVRRELRRHAAARRVECVRRVRQPGPLPAGAVEALAWCRKSCGLCKVAAEQGARLLRGLGAEDDVSGYGHRRSAAERARREQASGDSALLIVGSLFAVGMLGGCVLRSKACARREARGKVRRLTAVARTQ